MGNIGIQTSDAVVRHGYRLTPSLASTELIPEDPRKAILFETLDKLIYERTKQRGKEQQIWSWIKDYLIIKMESYDTLSPDVQNLFLFSHFRLIHLLRSTTTTQGDNGLLGIVSSTNSCSFLDDVTASTLNETFRILPPLYEPEIQT